VAAVAFATVRLCGALFSTLPRHLAALPTHQHALLTRPRMCTRTPRQQRLHLRFHHRQARHPWRPQCLDHAAMRRLALWRRQPASAGVCNTQPAPAPPPSATRAVSLAGDSTRRPRGGTVRSAPSPWQRWIVDVPRPQRSWRWHNGKPSSAIESRERTSQLRRRPAHRRRRRRRCRRSVKPSRRPSYVRIRLRRRRQRRRRRRGPRRRR
jgi:hypothetical protein